MVTTTAGTHRIKGKGRGIKTESNRFLFNSFSLPLSKTFENKNKKILSLSH